MEVLLTGTGRSRTSARHRRQHGDQLNEQLSARRQLFWRYEAQPAADIEDGGTLRRRTPGDAVEAGFVRRGELTRAFGDVEADRSSRAVELVGEMGVSARHGGKQRVRQSEEVQRQLIDVQVLVIKTAHA